LPHALAVGEHQQVIERVKAPEDVRNGGVGVGAEDLDPVTRNSALAGLDQRIDPLAERGALLRVEVDEHSVGECQVCIALPGGPEDAEGPAFELLAPSLGNVSTRPREQIDIGPAT
jgi:hypothetical protein